MWRNESKGDAVQVLFEYYFPFNGLLAGFLANNRFLILHGTSLRVEIHGSQWLDKNFNPVNVSRDVSSPWKHHELSLLYGAGVESQGLRERKGNRTLKFEEEFSMLSATRHHSHDSAKRSFIYYYSKDAQDESLKKNAEQVEEARLIFLLSRRENWRNDLEKRYSIILCHLLTISLDFVEIDLYPSKEREELLFDDYSSPSSPLFFFSRVPWPQSRSNLYTDDCQKQGKHGTRGSRLN